MTVIIIDSMETEASYFLTSLIESGISAKIEALPAGDFLIFGRKEENALLIERKTASDFLGSVEGKKVADGVWEKGRIWDQLKRMSETKIKDRWLIIEGSITQRLTAYRKKGFSVERIWGARKGIANWGVNIIPTKDQEETLKLLKFMVQKQKKPKKEFALRTSAPNTMTLEEKRKVSITTHH